MAPSAASQKDSMNDELLLLGNARQSLAAHQGADALRFLDEDAQRFPGSPFREERAYTRIRALCDLGRVDQARAGAERFLRQWPGSAYAAGVRRSCPFAKGETPPDNSLTGSRAPGH
jgi:outer membrane protein assembly factor BamD (BamD/ComL family)